MGIVYTERGRSARNQELILDIVYTQVYTLVYMNYITTTNLRTQTSELIDTLEKMGKVTLIHRSKIVGIIQPFSGAEEPFDVEAFKNLVKDLNLPKTTYGERKRIYRNHLLKKYGQDLS